MCVLLGHRLPPVAVVWRWLVFIGVDCCCSFVAVGCGVRVVCCSWVWPFGVAYGCMSCLVAGCDWRVLRNAFALTAVCVVV